MHVEGYTQPSETEARQFAEECAALVAKGRAPEIMDHYDTLYFLHNSSDSQDDSKAEYEDSNRQMKEGWIAQLNGMLSSATSCKVKSVEEGQQGQLVVLESPGKLSGLSVTILIYLDLIKKPDGEIVIYAIRHDMANR